jgi:hypothetical protein
MKKSSYLILIAGTYLIFSISCKKDNHVHNEQESINRVIYELKSSTETVNLSFNDADGDGGVAPVIIGGTLKANTTYTGSIMLYSLKDNQYLDLTSEVLSEGEEHQFFYALTLPNVIVTYTDKDSSNNPIGLSTSLIATSVGSGTLKVTLKHEPNKSAAGVSSGDITNAGGETDIEVSFPIAIN